MFCILSHNALFSISFIADFFRVWIWLMMRWDNSELFRRGLYNRDSLFLFKGLLLCSSSFMASPVFLLWKLFICVWGVFHNCRDKTGPDINHVIWPCVLLLLSAMRTNQDQDPASLECYFPLGKKHPVILPAQLSWVDWCVLNGVIFWLLWIWYCLGFFLILSNVFSVGSYFFLFLSIVNLLKCVQIVKSENEWMSTYLFFC